MTMRGRWMLAFLPALLAASPAAGPVGALAGRYYKQFPNGTIDGDRYTGEDIVEIVPVTADAAYIRVELSFFNGHSCSIAGIAQTRGTALVYREVGDDRDGGPCTLAVSRVGRALRLDDGEMSCRHHCGARGSLSRQDLPFAGRRPIRYLDRLKSSPEYNAAMSEWKR